MEIELIRQRRKTLVLNIVDSEHAVVKAPARMSLDEIQKFVNSKRAWLTKHSNLMMKENEFKHTFQFDKHIYLFGEIIKNTDELAKNFENLSSQTKARKIKKCYLDMFGHLEEMVAEISAKCGLKYDKVVPTNSVRVWGSFNYQKVMKLNYKLLILPRDVVRYVICHELCHGIHMNHKPVFWSSVGRICPDYKQLKKKLADYSFVLKENFE